MKGYKCIYRSIATVEFVLDRWDSFLKSNTFPSVNRAIEAGSKNLRKTYRYMDDTDVYILSCALNPMIKLRFIELTWDENYVKKANEVIRNRVSTHIFICLFALIFMLVR